jgi:hypothetical protein
MFTLGLLALLLPLSAEAITITFESSQGYTAGADVVGQIASINGSVTNKWLNSANTTVTNGEFMLASGVGVGGGNAVVVSNSPVSNAIRYSPTATDLDTNSLAAPYTGSLFFSFDFQLAATNTSATYIYNFTQRDAAGVDQGRAFRMTLAGNGTLQIQQTNAVTGIPNDTFSRIFKQGQWITVSGRADYSNQVTSLYTNGSLLGNYRFINSGGSGPNEIGFWDYSASAGSTSVGTLDNLRLSVIPEPSVLLGFALGATALALAGRKRA